MKTLGFSVGHDKGAVIIENGKVAYILNYGMADKKENKLGRKSNIATYEERIPEAFEMILYEKLGYTEFRQQGAKKWGITERAAEAVWKDWDQILC